MRFVVGDLLAGLNASLVAPQQNEAQSMVFAGVSYDSRHLAPGNLFVAIVGKRDGHDFVVAAAEAGASAALVSHVVDGCSIPQILVADTGAALTQLGRLARHGVESQVGNRVIGITGSVGKTSTKDFVAAALGVQFVVGASDKSLNNDQGLPTTLINAPDNVEALVLEMGMRGFGEIARLVEVARPHIGVITVVGESHGERVGGIEGIARAKSELVVGLGANDIAILNTDDPRVAHMASLTSAAVHTYGFAETADLRVVRYQLNEAGCAHFEFVSRWGNGECSLGVPGAHMVSNAAAALLVAAVCEVNLSKAALALGKAKLSPMRMALHSLPNGTLLDDSYNASPTSMIAALHTLAAAKADRHVAVVGVMAEIDNAEERHRNITEVAKELGIELHAYNTSIYGVPSFDSYEGIAEFFRQQPLSTAMLLKGSRVAGLDAVARLLLE